MLYGLPDPLLILQSPTTKFAWKNLCKSRVIDWWEQHIRGQAALLPSLVHFKSSYMSLTTPHPIWTTANSPYEISKAVISARMLSGLYRTDYLTRHWSSRNPSGHCTLPGCDNQQIGTLEHLLLHCSALAVARGRVIQLWANHMVSNEVLLPIVAHHTTHNPDLHLQFLLDPSSLPVVISASRANKEILGSCFYLSRTWIYTLHVRRSRLVLGVAS